MRIGVPAEINDNEHRVRMTPSGAVDVVEGEYKSAITYEAVAEAQNRPHQALSVPL